MFYNQPDTCKHEISQCLFLQEDAEITYKKPTVIGTSHLPQLTNILRTLPGHGICSRQRGRNLCGFTHVKLTGLDDSNVWRTAPAKQYPPKLCRTLAMAFAEALCDRIKRQAPDMQQAEEHDAMASYQPLDPYVDIDTHRGYGADYHKAKNAITQIYRIRRNGLRRNNGNGLQKTSLRLYFGGPNIGKGSDNKPRRFRKHPPAPHRPPRKH